MFCGCQACGRSAAADGVRAFRVAWSKVIALVVADPRAARRLSIAEINDRDDVVRREDRPRLRQFLEDALDGGWVGGWEWQAGGRVGMAGRQAGSGR